MFGESAINNIYSQQIKAPTVRVSLTDNYASESSTANPSSLPLNWGGVPISAEYVNGRYIVTTTGQSGLIDPSLTIANGNRSTVGSTTHSMKFPGKLVKTNGIVYAFLPMDRAAGRFYRVGTTDATNWFGGVTITIAGLSMIDFVPVSPTRIYVLSHAGTGATGNYYETKIKVAKDTGSWGATTVYDMQHLNHLGYVYLGVSVNYQGSIMGATATGCDSINGKTDENDRDHIFFRYSNTVNAIMGIRGIVASGRNYMSYKAFDVITPIDNSGSTTTDPLRDIRLANISQGHSGYYMKIRMLYNVFTKEGAFNKFEPASYGDYWLKSTDLEHWSSPYAIGESDAYFEPSAIAAGITEGIEFISMAFDYPVFAATFVGRNFEWLKRGTTWHDISSDVISLQIQDNSKVSLVLGNQR